MSFRCVGRQILLFFELAVSSVFMLNKADRLLVVDHRFYKICIMKATAFLVRECEQISSWVHVLHAVQ